MRHRLFLSTAVGIGAAALASAHAAWISDRAGERAIVRGHGAADDPLGLSMVTDVTGLVAVGSPVTVEVKPMSGVAVTNDILTDWDIRSGLPDADGKTMVIFADVGLNAAE
jgi:hypothetical protein